VELATQHGSGRKGGSQETAFLPTAVNSDQRRGSLMLNDYETSKLNTHLQCLFHAGALQFSCEFVKLEKPLIDLLKLDSNEKDQKRGPPPKLSQDMRAVYDCATDLEDLITTRLGKITADDEWPPSVTHTEYAKYKLSLGDEEVPRGLGEIKSQLKNFSSPLQAVAHILTFLEKDLHYLSPGSERWLNRVKVSRILHEKLDEHAQLSGTGSYLYSPLTISNRRNQRGAGTGGPDSPATTGKAKSRANTSGVKKKTNVKKSDKSSFQRTSKQSKSTVKGGAKKTSGILRWGKDSDDIHEIYEETPIQEEEFSVMSELLGNLTEDDHRILYDKFRESACWNQKGDIVELDDKNTSPERFREMIRWCESRLSEI